MLVENKKIIKAIHSADLSELLQKFNQFDDFNNEKIQCNVCNMIITKDSIGSVQLVENKLIFTCNKSSCYNEILKQNMKKEDS